MRYFHHELFWGNGAYSGLLAQELRKRLEEAMSLTGALQQAPCGPEPIPGETCRLMEKQLDDAVRDIVMALTHRDVELSPRKPWGEGTNMPGWKPVMVDHAAQKVGGAHCYGGPGYGKHYVVLLPDELVGNAEVYAKLLAPKPKGFRPDAMDRRDQVIHNKVCYDNSLCIQCGIAYDPDESGPYCQIHDPVSGKYYEQWWSDSAKEDEPQPILVRTITDIEPVKHELCFDKFLAQARNDGIRLEFAKERTDEQLLDNDLYPTLERLLGDCYPGNYDPSRHQARQLIKAAVLSALRWVRLREKDGG